MDVGFIGLGNIGGPMASNLLKAGHTLTAHDLRREAGTPLLEEGARWADSPREVAGRSDIVFNSLPGPRSYFVTATVPTKRGSAPVALVDDA